MEIIVKKYFVHDRDAGSLIEGFILTLRITKDIEFDSQHHITGLRPAGIGPNETPEARALKAGIKEAQRLKPILEAQSKNAITILVEEVEALKVKKVKLEEELRNINSILAER